MRPLLTPTARTMALIFGVGAGLAGYLGLGISIWQVAPGLLPQAAYMLFVGFLCLVIFAGYQRGLITQLRQDQEIIGVTVRQLQRTEDLVQGTFGLVVNLMEEPRGDKDHRFVCIDEEYIIRGNDGTYNWTFDGVCTAPYSSNLVVKVSGDSPCDGGALALSVDDGDEGGRKLDYHLQVDRPYCKVVAVRFARELRMGDEFRVRIRCRWDNTFPRNRKFDYVFSPWGVYATGGVGKISGRLVVDLQLADFLLSKFEDGEWVRASTQPLEVFSGKNRTVLEWEATNPAHVYQLAFEKVVSD